MRHPAPSMQSKITRRLNRIQNPEPSLLIPETCSSHGN
jgi:hypothetical protein